MALFDQKIKTLFTRFDQDKNGMIEVDDFQKWSASLAKYGSILAQFIQNKTKVRNLSIYFLIKQAN